MQLGAAIVAQGRADKLAERPGHAIQLPDNDEKFRAFAAGPASFTCSIFRFVRPRITRSVGESGHRRRSGFIGQPSTKDDFADLRVLSFYGPPMNTD
jgi:hypothetical protein